MNIVLFLIYLTYLSKLYSINNLSISERCKIAESHNIQSYGSAVIDILSMDDKSQVRNCLAKNVNVGIRVLRTLAGDKEFDVVTSVANNTGADDSVFEKLIESTGFSRQQRNVILDCIAMNPSVGMELLKSHLNIFNISSMKKNKNKIISNGMSIFYDTYSYLL